MKKIFSFLLLIAFWYSSNAQQKTEADEFVAAGVALHDKGEYDGAIAKYDEALKLDPTNLYGLAEKAMSLMYARRPKEAIPLCKKAIENHAGNPALRSVYVTYGSCLDEMNSRQESLAVFEEGIQLFPDFYLLYFNKGITLSVLNKNDEAIESIQQAIKLNPQHASSHNAIGRIARLKQNRIASLLAFGRFFVLEPEGSRAKENLNSMLEMMSSNVEKTGKKSVTINLDPGILSDTAKDGSANENSFAITDLILTMDAALDFDKKNKKNSEVEQFIRKFETVCASIDELHKKNFGFYWEYYAPYFIDMRKQGLIEPFAYIVFASSEEKYVGKWLEDHDDELSKFFSWSSKYDWKGQ